MIADRIKELRIAKGYTQAGLAKRLGLTRASINSWEMGITVPSTRYLLELSRIFHVSTDFLLGNDSFETIDVSSLSQKQIESLVALIDAFSKDK